MSYKIHVDFFDFDFEFFEFTRYRNNNNDFFRTNSNGNTFNLYDWVKNNVYLPYKLSGEVYDSDYVSLFGTGVVPSEDKYYFQMRIYFNPINNPNGEVFLYFRISSDATIVNLSYYYSGASLYLPDKELLFAYINSSTLDSVDTKNLGVYLNHFASFNYNTSEVISGRISDYELLYENETICNSYTPTYLTEITTSSGGSELAYLGGIYGDMWNPSCIIGVITNGDDTSNDYSTPGGGQGVVNDRSDYIPSDGVPSTSALSSGFINCYNPAKSEIVALHNFLMSDTFLDSVKKLMVSPIDYIISLHMLPIKPRTGNVEKITVGGISTEVSMHTVISQWLEYDCGTLNVEEYWGSFIDYSPYTKVSIFLPFVGVRELNMDDVMGSQLHLFYRIDVMSGACVASLQCISSRKVNAVLYNWNGNMAISVPISASDYREKVGAIIQSAISGASLAVSASSGIGVEQSSLAFASSIMNVATSKEGYSRSGSLSANNGVLSNFTPFLIISRPNQSLPSTYKQLNGYVSNIGGIIGDYSGYAEFREVIADGLDCLEEEKEMIVRLLHEGVVI